MAYSNTQFLLSLKQRGFIPTSGGAWTTEGFLRLATEVLRSHIVPIMLTVREEYFVTYHSDQIEPGKFEYDIHKRAVGLALRDLEHVTGPNPEDVSSIRSISPEQKARGANIFAHYLKWGKIVLTKSDVGGSLRQSFMIRCGELVDPSKAAQITAIDTTTNTLTFSSIPATFVNGAIVDFIAHDGGREYIAIDQEIVNVSTTDVVFASLPAALGVGDWVAIEGESPVPQIPDDIMPLLLMRTAAQINESQGYFDQYQAAMSTFAELKDQTLGMISPRVQGEPKVIVTNTQNRPWFFV